MNHLFYFFQKIGVDKSIAYSSGSRVVQGVTGVASIFFITTYLTGVEQGFYYTFGSLLALQVFFELGLTWVITQFVAHESSHLRLNPHLVYEGEQVFLSRLASLVHFCVKWYFYLAIVVFLFLSFLGYFFFSRYGEDEEIISWQIPWILICLGTAIKIFQSPFNSFFTGLGKVKEMSKIGFWQQIFLPLSTWLGLILGFKLYVVGIGYLISVLIWQLFVWNTDLSKIIINLWKVEITERVSYFKELFPYQWRIALSWVSGYFIFQLFNPVLFATEGAVVSGQMGMTLHALNAIQSFSYSWLHTKVPLYSKLIALKDYLSLDNLFNRTLKQMTRVCLFLLLFFLLVIWFINISQFRFGNTLLSDRFLGILPTFLLMVPYYLQQYIYSWATYLRCHKKEPFLVNSVCSGLLHCVCIIYFGNLFGLYGVIITYLCISITFFPWGYRIYVTNKRKWHAKN